MANDKGQRLSNGRPGWIAILRVYLARLRSEYDWRSVFYGLLAGVLCAGCYWIHFGDRYELISYDQRMRLLPKPKYESAVALVVVDSTSLESFGKWPWTGDRFFVMHEGLLEQSGAHSVAYDIIFDTSHVLSDMFTPTLREWFNETGIAIDASRTLEMDGRPVSLNDLPIQIGHSSGPGHSAIRRSLGDQPIRDLVPGSLPHIRSGIVGDYEFESAFRGDEEDWMDDEGEEELDDTSGRGFLACIFQVPSEGELTAVELGEHRVSDAMDIEYFSRFALDRPQIEGGEPPHAVNLILPRERLLESAAGCGSTLPTKDMDGIVRQAPLFIEYLGNCYPSLHLQLACDYLDVPLKNIRVHWGRQVILRRKDGSAVRIPIDQQGRLTLKYRRSFYDFPVVPFAAAAADIARGNTERIRPLIDGRIALIGAAAEALGDLWASPISRAYPGMATLATGIDNIINQDFLRGAPRWFNAILVGVCGLLAGLVGGALREVRLGLVTLLLLACYWAVAVWLFVEKSYWINMVHVSAAGFLAFGLISIHHVIQEQRNRKYVRHVLGKLVSEAVAEELAGSLDPSKLVLGGQLLRNTMLFTDLSGFTSLSEKVTAQQMVALLNEYFGHMVDIIDQEKGYVNKFMGDAIMVIYGHPLTYTDHALRAVRTAVLMQRKNRELQAQWEAQGLPILRMRVGVNTGEVVAGNIGSENRIEYSVIGDNVNLAQRLESNAPVDGIMISEATYSEVAAHVIVEKKEPIKVKGKAEPVQVYVVHDLKEES